MSEDLHVSASTKELNLVCSYPIDSKAIFSHCPKEKNKFHFPMGVVAICILLMQLVDYVNYR